MAAAAITMEKFTRTDFDPEQRDIRTVMRTDQLTKCNVRSIAAATGLNRETTRRKVKALVESGVLLSEGASIRLSPEYTRSVATSDMLQSLLETLVHSTNELARDGVLRSRG
jgi:DNA-binding IclR family transcriptional regulator